MARIILYHARKNTMKRAIKSVPKPVIDDFTRLNLLSELYFMLIWKRMCFLITCKNLGLARVKRKSLQNTPKWVQMCTEYIGRFHWNYTKDIQSVFKLD